jgi:outer membrane immunogenic protein
MELPGAAMNRLNRILVGCAAAFAGALSSSAYAADLPFKAAQAPDQIWTWTGFYIGAHAGAGWGTAQSTLTSISAPGVNIPVNLPFAQNSRSGFLGGGQVGYNYQSGWAVFGIQGDFTGMDVQGTTPCLEVISCTSKSDWLATVTGRFGGVVADRTLLYIKGGGAWMHTDQTATVSAALGGLGGLGVGGTGALSASTTSPGWLLGMGVEYAFARNWTGFLEYDYIEFQTTNLAFPFALTPGASINASVVNKLSIAKIGVNYKF